MGLKAAKEALAALIRSESEPKHFEEFHQQANAENNDRGAVILIATNLENALEYAIEAKLRLPAERHQENMTLLAGPLQTKSLSRTL